MKAWFRNYLDPLNLWRYSLVLNYSFLRVYKRWVWDSLLKTWLSEKPIHRKKRAIPSGSYTCLHCGEKKNMALLFCNDVEPGFFCSMSCRQKHGFHVVTDRDSDVIGHRSKWGCTFPKQHGGVRLCFFYWHWVCMSDMASEQILTLMVPYSKSSPHQHRVGGGNSCSYCWLRIEHLIRSD